MPPEPPVLLQPGETRAGAYDLAVLPGLEAQLRSTDAIVLWSYRLALDDVAGVTIAAVGFPKRRSDGVATVR